MKVRELLQIELWSKRTSRKILVGIGIVLGIGVVGFGALFAFERYWLTKGEQNAARTALVQIDALQNAGSISDEDFEARDKQAAQRVEVARQAVQTERDERVADALYAYLPGIETERGNVAMRRLMQKRNVPIKDSERKLNEEIDSMGKQVTQFLHSVLHKALD